MQQLDLLFRQSLIEVYTEAAKKARKTYPSLFNKCKKFEVSDCVRCSKPFRRPVLSQEEVCYRCKIKQQLTLQDLPKNKAARIEEWITAVGELQDERKLMNLVAEKFGRTVQDIEALGDRRLNAMKIAVLAANKIHAGHIQSYMNLGSATVQKWMGIYYNGGFTGITKELNKPRKSA